MIIFRSVFVGFTSDCVTRQTLLRGGGGGGNVSATNVPLGEVQCYLGKLLAVPGEGGRGGDGDGEGRRRGRWEMKMKEEEAESSPHGRNVAPSASRGWEAKSSGFRSRRTPSSALQAWMSSSSEPHYQYAKGQSLLLRENSSRVAFLLSLVRIQASVLHQQTQVTNAEGVFVCLFVFKFWVTLLNILLLTNSNKKGSWYNCVDMNGISLGTGIRFLYIWQYSFV